MSYQGLTIKSWAEDDRPREKLRYKGKHVLSDAELLAILLGSGTRNLSAVELARELLNSVQNNLTAFGRLTLSDLMKFNGIGEAKAITLLAALELGNRRIGATIMERPVLRTGKDVYQLMCSRLRDLAHEEFFVIFLKTNMEVIEIKQLSMGGMSGTIVDGKVLFRLALETKAHSMILCHNHPSGNKYPSDQDISITKKMIEFGKMIDLNVLDHVIFTDNDYLSLRESEYLRF